MADWSEKLSQIAQDTISKSKEVAEVAKLNLEISALNQKIREINTQVGAYVLEKKLCSEDEKLAEWAGKAADLRAEIESNQSRINDLKGVIICPGCGAAVPNTSRFCARCGRAMVKKAAEPEADEEIIDTDYTEKDIEEESHPEE